MPTCPPLLCIWVWSLWRLTKTSAHTTWPLGLVCNAPSLHRSSMTSAPMSARTLRRAYGRYCQAVRAHLAPRCPCRAVPIARMRYNTSRSSLLKHGKNGCGSARAIHVQRTGQVPHIGRGPVGARCLHIAMVAAHATGNMPSVSAPRCCGCRVD